MPLIGMLIRMGFCSLMLGGRMLMERNMAEMFEPAKNSVKATVDGKPVYSYIADD